MQIGDYIDLYKLLISYKEHEHNLVQHRLNWLLIASPILLTLYLTVLTLAAYALDKTAGMDNIFVNTVVFNHTRTSIFFLAFICVCGLALSYGTFVSVENAIKSLKSIEQKAADLREIISKSDQSISEFLPNVNFGFFNYNGVLFGLPRFICASCCTLWLIGIVMCVNYYSWWPKVETEIRKKISDNSAAVMNRDK
jgi:hypothetical protein